MAERVASILAEIGIDSSGFGSGVEGILGGFDELISGFGKTALSAGALAAAFTIVSEQLKIATDEAIEGARAQAKLDAVLRATSYAAGLTAEDLGVLGDELSRTAGLSDDTVKAGQAVMLTFRNIRGDNFRLAMNAAADLSAVMDTDLKSSVMQVSKALNDFSGYTALKRSGVSFSEEQERQIKNFQATNNLAAYQTLVLRELQAEVGGTAAAMTGAGDGSEALNFEIERMYENIGKELLPNIRNFNIELTQLLRTVNDNWQSVMRLWNALNGVARTLQFIGSLGISEVVRYFWDQNKAGNSADNLKLTPKKTNAIGGSFLIPQSYGREGFMLGNGDTASAGERITITPGYSQPQQGVTITGNINIGDTSQYSRSEIKSLIADAFVEVIGGR